METNNDKWTVSDISIVAMLLITVLSITFLVAFYLAQAIICNVTIPNQDGWNYLGEGTGVTLAYQISSTNCYGIKTYANNSNMIGDIPIYCEKIYTPVSNGFNGFMEVTFSAPNSSGNLLNRMSTYKVYERDFLWEKKYLVICK
jgi:hypothetical protein